jgi:pyruvate-formate lyase
MRAYDYASAFYYGGFSISENVLLGGLDADGQDATNDLSYLCLEAEANTKLSQPNLSVRIHAGTPEDFLLRACELVVKGRTKPQFFNDTIGIQMLLNSGVSLPDARNYSISGCVEPVPDNCIGLTNASMSNLGKALELALNNGRCRLCGERMGPETGDPTQFKSFGEVLQAYKTQVENYVKQMVIALNIIQTVHAEVYPLPFFSLLVGDCMEKGLDVTWGGARYNFTGPQGVGVANVADSLTAIDHLVFRSHVVTMEQLVAALNSNFAGCEDLRQVLMTRAPKYGQDNLEADKMMRLVGRVYSDAVNQYRDPRGGRYRAGLYSVPSNVPLGQNVGALPDGRLATTPLTDGVSPRHGVEFGGITGVIKSAARIDHVAACNGTSLNVRLEMR